MLVQNANSHTSHNVMLTWLPLQITMGKESRLLELENSQATSCTLAYAWPKWEQEGKKSTFLDTCNTSNFCYLQKVRKPPQRMAAIWQPADGVAKTISPSNHLWSLGLQIAEQITTDDVSKSNLGACKQDYWTLCSLKLCLVRRKEFVVFKGKLT